MSTTATDCRCEVRERGTVDEHVVVEDCPPHGLSDEERATYYEARQSGASHHDAMAQALQVGAWGGGEMVEAEA